MALSRTAWIGAGVGVRLLMIAVLIITVKVTIANENKYSWDGVADGFFKLRSYSYVPVYLLHTTLKALILTVMLRSAYMIAASVMGVAGNLLQIPVAFYLLLKSKRMTPSALILDISMYADVVITGVLATSVGAGFGATVDLLWYVDHVVFTDGDTTRKKYADYYSKAYVPLAFLVVGMVLSMAATVVSARLRARAANHVPDDV
ncbi:hypothetical protein HU200_038901 [Digitaria exilis]|uniref:CASP-like protein n=1 Tax=Digitaria exilis TaxID=1010633 RepID=A0A835BBS6_9POAL|nr:hypothetical protein HU200_038901 [Digitaria exilis]